MAKESKSRFILLGMLSHEPMSGYDIKMRVEHSIRYFWEIGYGQIYPELKKLVSEGLAVMEESFETEGRMRKVYRITSSGQEALDQWLLDGGNDTFVRMEFLLRVFFGARLPLHVFIEKLERLRQHHLQVLRQYELYQETLPQDPPGEWSDHRFIGFSLQFGEMFSRTVIEWCESVKQQLGAE